MDKEDLNEENIEDMDAENVSDEDSLAKGHSSYNVPDMNDGQTKYQLSGMFQNWYLDYASYAILERAVPHLEDGFKPVQRRILHSMRRLHDGRYNKVANIVGHTMQFHPHGDQSIGSALVQLGQKELLIDCQGNWGNIMTGDGAAAPRYIEARLSKFALDVCFNPKITEWKPSYDGRNEEPVTLPVKFPLLLAQGANGIAVGLTSKILPHNFNEIIDAAISYLRGEEFKLYPDFLTGGQMDVSKYNDGERGGRIKVRSRISKIDNKTLVINDIPYGETTTTVIESIIKANDKGKINIKKVEDNTASSVEIVIHLSDKTSSDKTIDALYAFTNCEVSISPNCCVITDDKPKFTTVTDLLQTSVNHTKKLLQKELEVQKAELLEQLNFCSLEKIFIEERIYKDKNFEESKDTDAVVSHIEKRLIPFRDLLVRDVTRDDILRLLEIKMKRILRFESDKSEAQIVALREKIEQIEYNLNHLVEYAISWYQTLKEKYGEAHPRRTEIRGFETINAAKVVEANLRLYVNRDEGFIGTEMKKDEYICNCSDIDEIIIFSKNGKYMVTKVADKKYTGLKNIIYVNVFKKNDSRTIYNVAYRDGKNGPTYIKRFAAKGLTRDKEYDVTQGTDGSRILYFSANSNAEAEVIRVMLKPRFRLKVTSFERDFGEIAIKGRQSRGNVLTKNEVMKITLKQKGTSTLGGRLVWFDKDVLRINYDGRGELLGEFQPEDQVLVINKDGEYYLTTFDDTNHFAENVCKVEKFNIRKVWSVALFDADAGYAYLKRFEMEQTKKPVNFIGDNPKSKMLFITDTPYPRLQISFGGAAANREPLIIDVDEFIGVKGIKAKGKRIHTWEVAKVEELEPLRQPDPEPEPVEEEDVNESIVDDDGQLSIEF